MLCKQVIDISEQKKGKSIASMPGSPPCATIIMVCMQGGESLLHFDHVRCGLKVAVIFALLHIGF